MTKSLKTDDLEYGEVDTLSHCNIVEVALRHGFDPELKNQFSEWVKEKIDDYISYRLWEEEMGDYM